MTTPWTEHVDPITGHRVHRARTRHGVEVWVATMPGFVRRFATLTTRFGSTTTHLPDGRRLPAGMAHFLEHQMFQGPEGDVFDLYAARGASANAYTTFSHTTYLFSCTSRFDENLATLLDTVAAVQTTPEAVEREKGIIGQEIAMYADDADWRGYFALLGALYKRHPCRVDILGSADSLVPIDAALLADVHAAFYAPANLVLSVAGDVDRDAILAAATARLSAPGRLQRRPLVAESPGVRRRRVEARVPIQRPQVALGLKDVAPGRGQRLLRQRVQTRVVVDALFGDGGRIQAPLHEQGWIDDSFGATYEAEPDAAFLIAGGETDDVPAFQRRLRAALRAAAREGLRAEDVERAKRRLLGRYMRVFNAPAHVANWMLGAALEHVPPTRGAELLASVTPRSATRRLRELAGAPHAWSVLLPKSEVVSSR